MSASAKVSSSRLAIEHRVASRRARSRHRFPIRASRPPLARANLVRARGPRARFNSFPTQLTFYFPLRNGNAHTPGTLHHLLSLSLSHTHTDTKTQSASHRVAEGKEERRGGKVGVGEASWTMDEPLPWRARGGVRNSPQGSPRRSPGRATRALSNTQNPSPSTLLLFFWAALLSTEIWNLAMAKW